MDRMNKDEKKDRNNVALITTLLIIELAVVILVL